MASDLERAASEKGRRRMSDIVERLRSIAQLGFKASVVDLCGEAASEITRLQAELSSLKASAEKLDKLDGMDGAACAVIRQKLDDFGAPRAAFIDDHVANGILHAKKLARAEALEEALSKLDSLSAEDLPDEFVGKSASFADVIDLAMSAIREMKAKS